MAFYPLLNVVFSIPNQFSKFDEGRTFPVDTHPFDRANRAIDQQCELFTSHQHLIGPALHGPDITRVRKIREESEYAGIHRFRPPQMTKSNGRKKTSKEYFREQHDRYWDDATWMAGDYFRYTRDRRISFVRKKDVRLTTADQHSLKLGPLDKRSTDHIEAALKLMIDEMINAQTARPLSTIKKRLTRIRKVCTGISSLLHKLDDELKPELSGAKNGVRPIRELKDFLEMGWSPTIGLEGLISLCNRGLALQKGARPDIIFYGFLNHISDLAYRFRISTELPSNDLKGELGEIDPYPWIELIRASIKILKAKTLIVSQRLDVEARTRCIKHATVYENLSDGAIIDRLRVIRVISEAGHMDHFLLELKDGHY